MAKRRSAPRRDRALPPLPAPGRLETGPDGYDYEVRPISGSRATKTYRCPGCDHEIRPGIPHVVVWQAHLGEDVGDDRRHWHTPCWANRTRRAPTRRWS